MNDVTVFALATANARGFLDAYDSSHPAGGFERAEAAHRFYGCCEALAEALSKSLGGDAAGRDYDHQFGRRYRQRSPAPAHPVGRPTCGYHGSGRTA